MIKIKVPGGKLLRLDHLVLDYNGTLAVDGKILKDIKPKLKKLQEVLTIHVITADTFGKVLDNLKGIPCKTLILKGTGQQAQKAEYIKKLGAGKTVAIGNGLNDAMMLKQAALGMAVIQEEGASAKTLMNADLVFQSITGALDVLINDKRLIASLRN